MKLPETYLIEVLRPEAKHILELLTKTDNEQENKELQSYYQKLADWGSTHLQKAGVIELSKIELSYKDEVIKLGLAKRTKDLWGMINALIELMKKHNLNEKNAKIIQQTTLEILAGLSKIPIPKKRDEKKRDDKKDPEPKASVGRDWTAYKAKKLANANGKPTSEVLKDFYDEYYSVEYAEINPAKKQEIIAKLKSLDKILIPEFNKLGYNPEVNPFAQFLKNLIKNKYEIFEKLTFNTYGAIHNSFIDRKITGDMLGNYDENNILFCNNLYDYKGLDIVNYLSLWRTVYNKADGNDVAKKLFATKVLINQPKANGNTYTEKVDSLKKLTNADIVLPTKSEAKMRSALEIRELSNYLFGAKPDKAELTEDDLTDAEEIIKKAVTNNVVLEMIRYIASQVKVEDSYKKAVAEWLKDAKYKQEAGHAAKCTQILLEYDVKPSAAKLIIQKLIKYYNKNTRKEEKKN